MTDIAAWMRDNDAYLKSAIAGIHDRLKRLAAPSLPAPAPIAPPSAAPAQVQEKRSWWSDRTSSRPAPAAPAVVAAPAAAVVGETAIVAGAAAPGLTVAGVPLEVDAHPAAALELQRLLGMTTFEMDVLLLCAAMELDTATADLCRRAQGEGRAYPTFALAMALSDQPAWDALSPERPLRYWRLIEIAQDDGQPLTTSVLRADARIVSYLKGRNAIDHRLAPFLTPIAVPSARQRSALSTSQQEIALDIARRLEAASVESKSVVQLVGPASSGKALLAAEAARQLGIALYRLAGHELPAQLQELASWTRLWLRETVLLPVGLLVDTGDDLDHQSSERSQQTVQRLLTQVDGLTFLLSREPCGRFGGTLIIEVPRPTAREQMASWAQALDAGARSSSDAPARLAGQFDFDLSDIQNIAASQRSLGKTAFADVWAACLTHSRPDLDLLAQRITPIADWNSLVLPAPAVGLLREIADQVEQRSTVYDAWGFAARMTRGLGISVLFDGESGTGKTMAAEVIANHLKLNLYRIDLSAVVSKYIGETEKNLRRLFDAAEYGGAILFFDEADAIFGKRSEVKDSHDRYANIEVNYLLQRMESYRGLAILATNAKSALDHAFMRRLRFVVKFPVPGPHERKAIWTRVFPAETPLERDDPNERVDYDRLASVNLTGGSINNAALNATFLAASKGSKVTMPLIIRAISAELQKTDRAIQPI